MPRPIRPPLYPRLKTRLAELDRSNVDVAAATGISPGTLSQIVRGHIRPSVDLMQRIADYLDAPVEELFAPAPAVAAQLDPYLLANAPTGVAS